MGCRHADFTNNHATPQPEAGLRPKDFQALSPRQRDVLAGLCTGKSNKQISYELGLSEGTVKIHVTGIFKSLGVRNRTQAVIAAQAGAA
jgi:DNA-binding NarL/FixJ family response regulator